jgi:putative ABC transport system substrate-binding protein
VTGISWFSVESVAKRLALLHELIPAAKIIAFMANPNNPELAPQLSAAHAGAHALDRQLIVVNAINPGEIDTAFATLLQQGARALIVASGPYFINQRAHVITLAAQHAIPMHLFRQIFSRGRRPDELRQ